MRLRVQYESLSEAYLRLAEQADRNDMMTSRWSRRPPRSIIQTDSNSAM